MLDGRSVVSREDAGRATGSKKVSGSVGSGGSVGPRGSQDRIFGLLAGLMILTAVILLVNSLVGPSGVAESPPEVELLSPSDGDILTLPLEIRFRSTEPLSMQPGGWGASNFHLHVEVAGQELMPGATDIRPASRDEYIWTVAALPPGETTIRLFWADVAHRAVAAGASNSASVVVR